MADTLIYILNNDTKNITIVYNNQLFRHLDTQLNEPTNLKNLIKAPKVGKPTNKKTLSQNFGDQCN